MKKIILIRKKGPRIHFEWRDVHKHASWDGQEYQLEAGWYYQAKKYLYRLCWDNAEHYPGLWIAVFQPAIHGQSAAFLGASDMLQPLEARTPRGIFIFKGD